MTPEKIAALFETVQVLPLRPTDVLVFKTSANLNAQQEQDILAYLLDHTGHSNTIILPRTADLALIRPEAPRPWWRFWE